MNDLSKLKVSSSPHIRAEDTTAKIMLDVLIALLPALAIGMFVYGGRALTTTLISAMGCVFFEWIYGLLAHKPSTIRDGSAAVTGVLLAFTLPATTPMFIILLGDLFARTVISPVILPIGAITSFLGGPLFLYLLFKGGKRQ